MSVIECFSIMLIGSKPEVISNNQTGGVDLMRRITARKDDPNTFMFYEIYKSQAAQDFHLQQDFTKKFLATLKSAQAADRVRTTLVEMPLR